MNLLEFQKQALIYAMYRKINDTLILYPSLGIIGECGEVSEKIKKLIRDDNWNMTVTIKEEIAKELGDCCWYLASICNDTNHDLSLMYEMRGATTFHKIRRLQLPQLVLHMHQHAVSLATSLQNWYYHHNGMLGQRDKYTTIPSDMSHVITCIEEIGHRCSFTLAEICAKNIEKLSSRKKRNQLSGSGDNR